MPGWKSIQICSQGKNEYMGKGEGGRFGKYGEQEKLKRLRQKRWDVLPQRIGKKYPERKSR